MFLDEIGDLSAKVQAGIGLPRGRERIELPGIAGEQEDFRPFFALGMKLPL